MTEDSAMIAADDIDVRLEPGYDAVSIRDNRPMLTWGLHPEHGNGWMLFWLFADGVAGDYFVPGDLLDLDYAVQQSAKELNWWAEHSEPHLD